MAVEVGRSMEHRLEGAKDGLERDAKENQRPPVGIDRNYSGKHLQIHFTVEDEGRSRRLGPRP